MRLRARGAHGERWSGPRADANTAKRGTRGTRRLEGSDNFNPEVGSCRFKNGAHLNVWYNAHFERLDDPFTLGGVTIAPGAYSLGEWRVSFDRNPSRRFYHGLIYSPQDFFGGTRRDATVKLGARLTDRVSTEAQYARNDVDLTAGAFDVDLASVRVDPALSPTVTLRTLTQYN